MKTYKYSEIFRSLQGEGKYTGANSLWIRWFLCNLQCDGFGQKDPTDKTSYELPYKDFDLINVKSVEELPVFEFGCDSSYTWSKRYKHLMADETVVNIADNLMATMTSESNPDGLFRHPKTLQETHMCFTGGEPMMKHNQPAIIELMQEFSKRYNCPRFVTVETNGTQPLSDEFMAMLEKFRTSDEFGGLCPDERGETEWFWSVSPKLFNTSGEKQKRAIKPDVLKQYGWIANVGHFPGQLKYVVNGTDATWDEVEEVTKMFRDVGIDWPVYIMPVGATKESQEGQHIADICNEALARGYNVSGRLHAYIYGNQVGT
jgi:6-pyruvoyltetrahydropterin 2'-reductase